MVRWGKLPIPGFPLAYTFDVVAWQPFQSSRRFSGLPYDPSVAKGVKVVVTNPDDPSDTHQFWAYALNPMQDWSEWWVLIGALMVRHGMPLEDEDGGGIIEEPPEDDEDFEDEEPEEPERPSIGRRIVRRLRQWFRR